MKRPIASLITLLCLGACLLGAAAAPAQEAAPETRIKAAFLYKFCHYVEWPDLAFEAPDSPIRIGIVGAENIADEFERAARDHSIGPRPLQLHRLGPDADPAGIHLLFVDAGTLNARPPILERLQRQPVLLVTDSPAGLDKGGTINFAVENDRVRFDVSLAVASQHSLRISSQLLSVARQVRRAQP